MSDRHERAAREAAKEGELREIAEIEKRWAAATNQGRDWRAANGKGAASVKTSDCAIYINVRTVETPDCVKRWQADAIAIAAAPTDIRRLIAIARAAIAQSLDARREQAGGGQQQ